MAVNTIKPFLLFSAAGPDGAGGWHDFDGSYETVEEAVSFAHKNYDSADGWWWHVVYLRSNKIIWSSC